MPEVNLKEMARVLGCSLPTMQALPDRFPDMPIVERGGMGKAWRFQAEAVVGYMQQRRADEEAARAEKDELLAQLSLPIGAPVDAAGKELSYEDKIKAAKLRALLRQEQVETRFLVSTLEVRDSLQKVLRGLAINTSAALTAIQREHNIPEPVMAAIRAKFDNARTAFVRDAGELLAQPAPVDDGEFRLAAE